MTGVASGRRTLTIGTRGSKLALIQTELVRAALLAQHPDLRSTSSASPRAAM